MGDKDLKVSIEFSRFKAGDHCAPWERQDQLVTGLALMLNKNTKIFFEYINVKGYAPLNKISGDDTNSAGVTVAGTTHSLRNAMTNVLMFGIQTTC